MLGNNKTLGVVTMEYVYSLQKSNLATVIRYHRISTHLDPAIPLMGIYPGAIMKRTTKFMCKKRFTVAIVTVARNWKPFEGPQRSDTNYGVMYLRRKKHTWCVRMRLCMERGMGGREKRARRRTEWNWLM